MFVFLILFWDIWKFRDAGEESNLGEKLVPNPAVLLSDEVIIQGVSSKSQRE